MIEILAVFFTGEQTSETNKDIIAGNQQSAEFPSWEKTRILQIVAKYGSK